MSDIVCFKQVRKSFGDAQVLKGVSFSVAPGQVVALIGRSGSARPRRCAVSTDWKRSRTASCMSAAGRWNAAAMTCWRCARKSASCSRPTTSFPT